MLYDYLMLDPKENKPLYQQLYEQVRRAVQKGYLAQGEKMPSIRRLSEDLHLSRTTIETAYQQLCVEGYLKSRPQSGYFVAAAGGERAQGRPFARENTRTVKPERFQYNLGTDVVDLQNADLIRWKRCIRDALNRKEALVSYGDKQGEPELREALSSYSYSVRGVISAKDSIVIGAGTQTLLSVLCGLIPRKKIVAVEEPGFPQAEQIFRDYGFTVRRVGTDQWGVSMEALEASKAEVLFVNPASCQKNGGAVPMSRRLQLLNWVQGGQRLLIEDDYNGELRYSARPIPALQSLSGGRGVAYLGSFSKLLLPSVRIGYLAMPEELLEAYFAKSGSYNQTSSKIEQLALARYIKEGNLERQLRRLRKLYGTKSRLMFEMLQKTFRDRLEVSLWETGLCFRMKPNRSVSVETLVSLAAAQGVRLTLRNNQEGGEILAGFAGISQEKIPEAVKALQKAWEKVLELDRVSDSG